MSKCVLCGYEFDMDCPDCGYEALNDYAQSLEKRLHELRQYVESIHRARLKMEVRNA